MKLKPLAGVENEWLRKLHLFVFREVHGHFYGVQGPEFEVQIVSFDGRLNQGAKDIFQANGVTIQEFWHLGELQARLVVEEVSRFDGY